MILIAHFIFMAVLELWLAIVEDRVSSAVVAAACAAFAYVLHHKLK